MDELNHTVAEYSRQADDLEELLSICSATSVVWAPGAGRWSILEITAHLAELQIHKPQD